MSASFSACEPCDMLIRTPFTPAARRASMTAGSRVAGPSVARIFAFLNTDFLVVVRHLNGHSSLVQTRNQGYYLTLVLIEFRSELFAQQSFFTSHADDSANKENDESGNQSGPMTDSQTRRQQHAQHSNVNRMAHKAIGTIGCQFVTLDQPGGDAPLFSQCAD